MSPIANTFPRAQSELGSVAVIVLPSESVNTEIYMRTIFIIVHDVFFKRAVVCITLTDILGVHCVVLVCLQLGLEKNITVCNDGAIYCKNFLNSTLTLHLRRPDDSQ